jgi:pyruvate/2-oxoglutarate dehydrogenase complex dihydrolipoamide acyltransferase (E2) component
MKVANRVYDDQPVRGEQAYIYCLKARAQRHHCLGYGTFSVDLDSLEHQRKEYSRRIKPITHVPLYIKATALALQRNPEANAILFKKLFGLRIVRFETVDVNLPITRMIGDRMVTFIGTVRNAAAKTLAAIQDEVTAYQRCAPSASFAIRRIQRFSRMPLWQARVAHWRMTRSPEFYLRNAGTCGVTFVDGDWGEYMFPIAPTSVVFGIGTARSEPVVHGATIRIRRMLKCSLMLDNYVLSGLTGARLVRDFKNFLESGSFVVDELGTAASSNGAKQNSTASTCDERL